MSSTAPLQNSLVDLRGQVILVPGASGGMGRDVALLLAQCGASVALTYFSREAPAREVHDRILASGGRSRLDRLDTTDRAAVKAWVDEVAREQGSIHVLASCVGGHLPEGFKPFMEQDPARWHELLESQFMSYVYLVHAVLPHMVQNKGGRLLTISSDGGKVGESGVAIATACHGGLIAFSKSIGREMGRHGITANLVCPGPTEGPTIDYLRGLGNSGSRMVEEMIRRVPMKRLGTSHEVAGVMAFLASPAASFINGQAISVSGGLVMN